MKLALQKQAQVVPLSGTWQRWGKYTFIILLIGILLGYLSYQGWQFYQDEQGKKASTLFIELEKNRANPKQLIQIANTLVKTYPSTGYASRAALIAAKASIEVNDLVAAQKQLEWVSKHAKEEDLRNIARLRTAALLLDNEQYDQALEQMRMMEGDSYSVQSQEIKGDILAAFGKPKQAIEAYTQALAKVKDDAPYRIILTIKRDAVESI